MKYLLAFFIFFSNFLLAQEFSRADSLRGFLFPERSCYDVTFYHLKLKVDPQQKYIRGSNEIHFKTITDFDKIQVDLFENFQINAIMFNEDSLSFSREGNAIFVHFKGPFSVGQSGIIEIFYEGNPREARLAPWDGGFSWKKDENGEDWIGVSCQGLVLVLGGQIKIINQMSLIVCW